MPANAKRLISCLVLTAAAALGQSKLAFEVATIRPAAPLEPLKMIGALRSGGQMPMGPRIGAGRAEYTFMSLKALISLAYNVKSYQITGPEWLDTQRFDIVAKYADGASRDDAPQMLRSLLEERFRLVTHRGKAEQPVLALVVSKGGLRLKVSAETPLAIDRNSPLKPGEIGTEGPAGPVRVFTRRDGGRVVDMGIQGRMTYKMDPAAQSTHIDMKMVTMAGFVDALTQMFSQMGAGSWLPIVDLTGVKGNYDGSLNVAGVDMTTMARTAIAGRAGGAVSGGTPGNVPSGTSDPSDASSSLIAAVQSLGLRLDSRRAMIDQLIVDHAEKTPIEN